MVVSFVPALWKAAMRFAPVRFVVVIVGLTTRQVVAPLDVPSMVAPMLHATKVAEPDAGLKVNGLPEYPPMLHPITAPAVEVKLFAFPKLRQVTAVLEMLPINSIPVADAEAFIWKKLVLCVSWPNEAPIEIREITAVPVHSWRLLVTLAIPTPAAPKLKPGAAAVPAGTCTDATPEDPAWVNVKVLVGLGTTDPITF